MGQLVIIGGGIIGLASAYYLQEAGFSVTVLDQADFEDNCSYGNMGYICPSHFIPLASPGKVRQGLKWMFNAQSPFYIHPSPSRDLMRWGFTFLRHANRTHGARSAVPLRDIALLSHQEYQKWSDLPEFQFTLENRGLLEIFRTPSAQLHAEEIVRAGNELGLAMDLLDKDHLQQLEPQTTIDALGALHFRCDSHVYPNQVMKGLRRVLTARNVALRPRQKVIRLEHAADQITRVVTETDVFDADQVVLAAGSWSAQLAASLGVSFPLMPGRGYSVTVENGSFHLNHPALLMERSVALTPLSSHTMRFGGTMEVVPIGKPPRPKRMMGIVNAVNAYFPDANLQMPAVKDIWFGYRPCSGDGLPYIGRTRKYSNLLIATGHSMIGMSLGAGTGKLVAELAAQRAPSVNLAPFAVERFS